MTSDDLHVLDDLIWRGVIAVSTDLGALRSAIDAGPLTFYCGFDPSAASLHHGHLVQVLTVRRLQRAGLQPLALVGGSTGLVGDPRPTAERGLHSKDVVAEWTARIRGQIEPYLAFDGPQAARMVNNLDWTAPLSALDFLRDVGKHFSVNRMLGKEAISARLASEGGISYAEFSYQLLQALDFLELNRRYGCLLQTGGSDQWGNITAGLDLIRRVEGVTAHGIGTPLLTKADGTKFGKSEGGAIWLDPDMTSPYAFFQVWLQAEDAVVGSYLRILSDRSRDDIEALEAATRERPQAREAQRALARELTTLVHGGDETARVEAAAAALFGRSDLTALDERTLAAALQEAPSATVAPGQDPTYAELLAATGLVPSTSAARRTVAEGGAYVNNERIDDPLATPPADRWLHGRYLVLRRGRQHVAGVVRGGAPDGARG
ncbi:MAG TPA: tyrosine--tRNA ligase [Mycobacteriales bacterium]